MTHLYVVSATNLFHLEGPSDGTEPRDLGINLPRSCAPGHEFRQISQHFSIEASIQARDHDLFIIECVLLSVFRIHRIIQNVRNERRIYIDRSFEWNNESKKEHIEIFK